jgi:16S rRNA (uracil1498-N3)-methyltransferase
MNVLLVRDSELDGSSVYLSDRRAEHLKKVLKVEVSDEVRGAVIGRGAVVLTVLHIDGQGVRLGTGAVRPVPAPTNHVVLSIPRPKALSRIIQAVSSFGVASITLINAWKVEKSYLDSPRLEPERLHEDAVLGCEQGRQCHVPRIAIFPRFMAFIHDGDPQFPKQTRKLVLDPEAGDSLGPATAPTNPSPSARNYETSWVMAFGPDGGFVPRELETLRNAGYVPARLNTGPLRTEVAVAATLGVMTTWSMGQGTGLV